MTYTSYINLSREELLEKMAGLMKPKRLKHVIGVEQTAVHLAELYNEDPVKAGLAGLVHDYAKEFPDETFLHLIDKYQLNPELKSWGNNVWHGLVGSYKIKEDLGLIDSSILSAIQVHTVGSGRMSKLDKILYVADYIEPNRSFAGVEEARALAEHSLDKAVAYETVNTVAHLAKKAKPIFPQTLETYNAYVHFLKED